MAKGSRDSPILAPSQGETIPLNNLGTSDQTPDGAVGGCQIGDDKLPLWEDPEQKTDNNQIQIEESEFTEQEISILIRKANQTPCDGAIGGCQIEKEKLSVLRDPQDDPDSARTFVLSKNLRKPNHFRTQLNETENNDSVEDKITSDLQGKVVPSGKCCIPSYPLRVNLTDAALYLSGGDYKDDSQKQEELWNDIQIKDKYLEYKPLKEIHERHQGERNTNPEEDCGPFHHPNVQQQGITELDKTTMKENIGPCIGRVMFKDEFMGTCICIRGSDHKCSCITAFHVVQSAIDMTDQGTEEECYQHTTIQFNCGRFYMKQIVRPNFELDYAQFELIYEQNCKFPPAWTKIGSVPKGINHPIYIVAYQGGQIEWDYGATSLNISVLEGLNVIENYYRTRFNLSISTADDKDMKYHFVLSTKFVKGSSGGLVLKRGQNGEFVGIGVVICGYPNEYYTNLELKQKAEVKGCYLFECGLSLKSLQIEKLLCCDLG